MPRIFYAAFAACLGICATQIAVRCSADETEPSAVDVEFFEQKIRPILVQRCFECHVDQGKGVKGGLSLDSRAALLTGGDSGPVLSPGKPEASLIIDAINYGQESAQMPPRGKLPQNEIDLLTDWVRRGAPFPGAAPKSATPHRKGIDFEAAKSFWSFQPLHQHSAPTVKNPQSCRQPIDYFLAATLDQQQLAFSPAADRRTLLRRLSFDLTGLPPTQAELLAFEADTASDAYEQQVERLLASPHYGERWGRFWLDVVRYCDIAEPWSMDQSARAWLYRDWVVQSLNNDLGFNRFLELQLAADLLPDAQPRDIAALGFLGLSPVYWKELKLDQAVIKSVVAEEWEERIHTLSGALLGLTVSCARCHDHKYDPVSQEDYYALAGILASTKLTVRPTLPADEARAVLQAREQIAAWQKEKGEVLAKKPETEELKQQAEELTRKIAELERNTPHIQEPFAYAVEEASQHILPDGPDRTKIEYHAGEAMNVALQIRGNPVNLGPVVPRRFLRILANDRSGVYSAGSGRGEFARSLVSEGAPLTARVIVNRVWQQHFGRGLVETVSNFGTTGALPTHPELLDDLAARFVAAGWSLKWLHRQIVLSTAYRQTSGANAAATAIDPDNRFLWRANRRRLDIEFWRDAVLMAAGRLDLTMGGADRSLDEPENVRRTIYSTVKRRELHAMLKLNDFPDPTTHNGARDLTTTPLQQLFFLNSPFMQQQSAALADRVRREIPDDLDRQISQAYWLVYGREPSARQRELAQKFFASAANEPAKIAELWKQYAQVLLSSNEAAFID